MNFATIVGNNGAQPLTWDVVNVGESEPQKSIPLRKLDAHFPWCCKPEREFKFFKLFSVEQVPGAFFKVHERVCEWRPNFEPQYGQHFILQNWRAWSCWKVCDHSFRIWAAICNYASQKVMARNKNSSKVLFFHILRGHAKGLSNDSETNNGLLLVVETALPSVAAGDWAPVVRSTFHLFLYLTIQKWDLFPKPKLQLCKFIEEQIFLRRCIYLWVDWSLSEKAQRSNRTEATKFSAERECPGNILMPGWRVSAMLFLPIEVDLCNACHGQSVLMCFPSLVPKILANSIL